jgi:hypothetical protein
MSIISIARGVTLLLTAFLLVACEGRGTFGPEACGAGDRVGVDGAAVAAVYYDKTGASVSAEELKGTTSNKMCPTPDPGGSGACPAGYCARTMSGKTYCLRC